MGDDMWRPLWCPHANLDYLLPFHCIFKFFFINHTCCFVDLILRRGCQWSLWVASISRHASSKYRLCCLVWRFEQQQSSNSGANLEHFTAFIRTISSSRCSLLWLQMQLILYSYFCSLQIFFFIVSCNDLVCVCVFFFALFSFQCNDFLPTNCVYLS